MAQPKVSYAFEKIVSLAAETNIVDAWNMVIRKAAEIEVDEGNPRELFDTIGIRPFIEQETHQCGCSRRSSGISFKPLFGKRIKRSSICLLSSKRLILFFFEH